MPPSADHPTDLPPSDVPQKFRRREDLVAMLGSRICHDIISPVSAIGNGVELLAMGGKVDGPEMDLIVESVNNAKARVRFFRVAFGLASDGAQLGEREIRSIIEDMTRGGRTRIEWQLHGDRPRGDVKLVFLALQCLETAMPYGGTVEVTGDDTGWQVSGTADKMKTDAALFGLLTDGDPNHAITAAQVQFALLPIEAARQDRQVSVEIAPTRIDIRF